MVRLVPYAARSVLKTFLLLRVFSWSGLWPALGDLIMAYVDAVDGMLLDHWFFKYEAIDDVITLPENFLCDQCGMHVSRHAYISPPGLTEWRDGEAEDCECGDGCGC